jgi:putrescine transport system ATP-binding protein
MRDAPTAGDNWARGSIKDIAYMGDISIFVVVLDGGREVRVTQTNIARSVGESFSWGESVHLVWDASSPVVGAG